MSVWIFRKPAAKNTFLLKEHLVNAPEAGESETADNSRHDVVLHKQRKSAKSQPGDKPDPPAPLSKTIFHFNDGRMAYADAEENSRAYDDSTDIHNKSLQWQRSAMAMDFFRLKR